MPSPRGTLSFSDFMLGYNFATPFSLVRPQNSALAFVLSWDTKISNKERGVEYIPVDLFDDCRERAGAILVKGGGDIGESVVALITDTRWLSGSKNNYKLNGIFLLHITGLL